MQFQVGDRVVHPVYGIGHIATVEERQFTEATGSLYYQITWPRCEVWIPVEAQESSGLRPVTAKSDLDQFRSILKGPLFELPTNYRHRHQILATRLEQGAFQGLCEVVRDLTAWSQSKPLDPTDTATLQKTRISLHQEWALAAGVSLIEAVKEIDALLLSARSTSLR
jgi:CarD family transcriptional regulator